MTNTTTTATDLDTIITIRGMADQRFICRVAAEEWLRARGFAYVGCTPLADGAMRLQYEIKGEITAFAYVP